MKTSSSHLAHARALPQELVEMIMTHVLLDTPTLKACSATCGSWYIAALPHLHYTPTLLQSTPYSARRCLESVRKLGKMQLLPLVTRLRVFLNCHTGAPPSSIINPRSPAYFSALTKVQGLTVGELDFHEFSLQMELCFGRFAPKLRSLALDHPKGVRRDLLCFIGWFPNLDNSKLRSNGTDEEIPGHSPVPQSARSMRRCLTLRSFGEGFSRDLSKLCGGLRFHSVDLVGEEGARLLLDACAETLATFRVFYIEPVGMGRPRSSQSSFI